MKDFITRKPILNSKAQLHAYRIVFGGRSRNTDCEGAADQQSDWQLSAPVFAEITRRLSEHRTVFIDFFDALPQMDTIKPAESDSAVFVVFGRNTEPDAEVCASLKSRGYRLAFDSSVFTGGAPAAGLADMMILDFTSVGLAAQTALIKKYKNRVLLMAEKIETWGDFKVARDMGFNLFQGFFFLWPTGSLIQNEIKSLDVCLVGILQELDKPEPNFKAISDLIEHDLGLSYKLLRLVNSAYMAPKYKIRSISQALTFLGTRELHQWISMLMFSGVKNDENSELVSMSLIRGKMMSLVAQELQLAQSGSESFFTGLFSVIDVILNRDMNAVLTGLPLPDDVKTALTGGGNNLAALLDFVVAYEQADWQKVENKEPMNRIPPQQLVSFYLAAHQWSRCADSPSWNM